MVKMKVLCTLRDGSTGYFEIYGKPEVCPLCKYNIDPTFCWAYKEGQYSTGLEVVFKCTRESCDHLFLAYYEDPAYGGRPPGIGPYKFSGRRVAVATTPKEFSEHISKISPKFPVIYNQAMTAEKNGLNEICGPGYGRALEFLIKDYLICLQPEKCEEIKKMWLGEIIKLIDDKNIKVCAERAAWLRNDETHYTRQWEDKDLENLKDLIDLTVIWIEASEKMKKYETEMPKK